MNQAIKREAWAPWQLDETRAMSLLLLCFSGLLTVLSGILLHRGIMSYGIVVGMTACSAWNCASIFLVYRGKLQQLHAVLMNIEAVRSGLDQTRSLDSRSAASGGTELKVLSLIVISLEGGNTSAE
jgi:hypothetical protein